MDELFNYIDEILEGTIKRADSVDESIRAALYKYLSKLETKEIDGETIIVNSDSAQRIIAGLKRDIELIFADTEAQEIVKDLLGSFDDITDNVSKIHAELNGIELSENFLRTQINPVKSLAVDQTAGLLTDTLINSDFKSPIVKTLLESTYFGYSIPQAQKALEAKIGYSKHIGQVARDSMFGYDGTINGIIAEKYGMNAFRYVGGLVTDSRGQCRKWVKMGVIPFDQVEAELLYARTHKSYNGHKISGLIEGTTLKNFSIYRGGYNCRHRAIPVFI